MARSLVRSRIGLADTVRNRWAISPEGGTTIDEVMKPEYTANTASVLKRWDVVEVRPDDETYYAELLVKTAELSAIVLVPEKLCDVVKVTKLLNETLALTTVSVSMMSPAMLIGVFALAVACVPPSLRLKLGPCPCPLV